MAGPDNLIAHRFKPGQSGNPEGRPKGLSRLIRARTDDGEAIYAGLWTLATSAAPGIQLEALKLLAAYAYGVPGRSEVEWDEDRVRETAVQLGRDPDAMVHAWRVIEGHAVEVPAALTPADRGAREGGA